MLTLNSVVSMSFNMDMPFFSNMNTVLCTIAALHQVIEPAVDFPGDDLAAIGLLVRENLGQPGPDDLLVVFRRRFPAGGQSQADQDCTKESPSEPAHENFSEKRSGLERSSQIMSQALHSCW